MRTEICNVSIREQMSRNPGVAAGVAGAAIVAAILLMVALQRGPSATSNQAKDYFTVDDGVTLFEDDAAKQVPFTHDGMEAVRAVVMSCDGGRTKTVVCLRKVGTPSRARGNPPPIMPVVKKPGTSEWIGFMDPRAAAICSLPCSDGTQSQPILP